MPLGNGSLKNPGLKGSLWNQKWCLKEPFQKVFLRHLYMFLKDLFKEMVLLWHHSEEPFPVPDGTLHSSVCTFSCFFF